MELLSIWWVNVIIYLIAVVTFTQTYKKATGKVKKEGALTVLLEGLTGIIMLIGIPFCEMKWPTDGKVYILTGIIIVFYCLKDRLDTTVRRNLEGSTVNILEQVLNIFMILWGVLFFKEEMGISKIIGAILIILSNVMIFYQKGKFTVDKYVGLGVIANLFFSIALALNVDNSEKFNFALYQSITLAIPAILIFCFSKLKVKDLVEEWKEGEKTAIVITTVAWAIKIVAQLRAYQTGSVTTVATLCALSAILNVFASYFFLKERDNMGKKIIAAIIIIFSVFLVK